MSVDLAVADHNGPHLKAPLLEVNNLKVHFTIAEGVVKAVDDISFDLLPGETVGIVGESGCGKSVTASAIMRLVAVRGKILEGQMLFEGHDLMKLSDQEMRRLRGNRIAMIFQDPMSSLNPTLTIGRQLTEPLILHIKMTPRAAWQKGVELLEMVGIPNAEARMRGYPHQMSGGTRQRVLFVMALTCSPSLLIADEPTTLVDVTTQAQLMEILKDMTSRLGTAVIFITHNLGLVARHAQRVNVMYAGKIVEKGTVSEIFENPKHPYTLGLLASVPQLDDETPNRRLRTIPGSPPNPIGLPPTCAFLPRCDCADDVCKKAPAPPLRDLGNNHEVACLKDVAIAVKCS